MLETLTARDPHAKTKDEQQGEAAPVAPPCAMVIFGAAGDLTKRLTVDAAKFSKSAREKIEAVGGEAKVIG